jgi:hypothetical protein
VTANELALRHRTHQVRRLLHHVLGTSSAMDPNAIARCLQDCVTAAAPELRPWVSLLGVVLDISIPPSSEVAELEEQHRAERVPELYADLLERMVQPPVILVVEDSYLADSASEGVSRPPLLDGPNSNPGCFS